MSCSYRGAGPCIPLESSSQLKHGVIIPSLLRPADPRAHFDWSSPTEDSQDGNPSSSAGPGLLVGMGVEVDLASQRGSHICCLEMNHRIMGARSGPNWEGLRLWLWDQGSNQNGRQSRLLAKVPGLGSPPQKDPKETEGRTGGSVGEHSWALFTWLIKALFYFIKKIFLYNLQESGA